jgi:hypothetical protein
LEPVLYFILNNTAPDDSITKALQGLTILANELAKEFRNRLPIYSLDKTMVWKMERFHGIYFYFSNYCFWSDGHSRMLY